MMVAGESRYATFVGRSVRRAGFTSRHHEVAAALPRIARTRGQPPCCDSRARRRMGRGARGVGLCAGIGPPRDPERAIVVGVDAPAVTSAVARGSWSRVPSSFLLLLDGARRRRRSCPRNGYRLDRQRRRRRSAGRPNDGCRVARISSDEVPLKSVATRQLQVGARQRREATASSSRRPRTIGHPAGLASRRRIRQTRIGRAASPGV
jgi:hypothetical protein